jgi:hypothetical protein
MTDTAKIELPELKHYDPEQAAAEMERLATEAEQRLLQLYASFLAPNIGPGGAGGSAGPGAYGGPFVTSPGQPGPDVAPQWEAACDQVKALQNAAAALRKKATDTGKKS